MAGPTDPSFAGVALLAVVDVLALLGGFLFVWRALKRLWRFAGVVRRESLEIALRRVRQVSCRQAMRCATDESYYLSRLTLLFAADLVSLNGLIFSAVCLTDVGRAASDATSVWMGFAIASLLIFTVLSMRSFYRTVKLARLVLQIRRRIRTVDARKRRLALAEQSSVSGYRLGLVQP